MKKSLIVFVSTVVFILLVGITARAAGEVREYAITERDGEYILSLYNGGSAEEVAAGEIGAVLSGLSDNNGSYSIYFDNVTARSSVDLPSGSYTVSGSLHCTGGEVNIPTDAEIVFRGFSCTLENYCMNIFGKAEMYNIDIASKDTSAVVLRGASAKLTLFSGTVKNNSSEHATLDIQVGSTSLSGGLVENASGAAILDKGELTLSANASVSGIGVDILFENPIALSSGTSYFNKKLELEFLGSFEQGCATELFLRTNEKALNNITVYDENGKTYAVKYFSSADFTSDECFGAVYLPFEITYHFKSGERTTCYVLKGESAAPVVAPEIAGYDFDGWYIGDGTSEKFDGTSIESDTAVYARYSLTSPSFTVSSLSFTYDGSYHSVSFSSLEHPLDDSGFYEFQWYKSGQFCSASENLRVKNVSDSGIYSCVITFRNNSDSVSVVAENIEVRVDKLMIPTPKISAKVYSGVAQSPEIAKSSYYRFEEASYRSAGVYYIVFTLSDFENTSWEVSDDRVLNLPFEILRAENEWEEELFVGDTHLSSSPSPRAHSKFGEVRFLYSTYENTAFSEEIPSTEGVYYVKAVVDGTEDYTGLESEAVSFRIMSEKVEGLFLVTMPAKTVYRAFDSFDAEGIEVRVYYDSGREEIVGYERLGISYQNGDAFRFGDSGAVVSYGGVSLVVPVTVEKIEYDLSNLEFGDFSTIFSGSYQSSDESLPEIYGMDGIELMMKITGGGTVAGSYEITLSFSTESRDYLTPKPITVTMTILPLGVELVWEDTEFVYDGGLKLPKAYYTDVFGVAVYPKITGAQTNAGNGYTATALTGDGNYAFNNASVTFDIKKADYDFSGVSWSDGSFVYSGEKRGVYVSGLPLGVSVVGYTDNEAVEAGKYSATASLSWDKKNYNTPPRVTCSWEILPAEYDISGFSFGSAQFVYDGDTHYPVLEGKMPVGADGIALGYSFSLGATHVSEGEVTVTVTFNTKSKNYNVPAEQYASVVILPRGINVVWGNNAVYYTGKSIAPSANAVECSLTVLGGGVNVGKYTARAVSDNADYYVVNEEYSYEILKSPNKWITEPSPLVSFEGKTPNISAVSLVGRVELEYFTDRDCECAAELPLRVGTYFAKCYVTETDNYFGLSPVVVSFEVIEIIPVSMSVTVTREKLVAFERLSATDYECFLINNDGSKTPVEHSSLSISYENGDSMRAIDEIVIFDNGEFIVVVEIDVSRADYDLSGVSWLYTSQVYDGTEKTPILSGLPDGITVTEYVGGGAVCAGEYEVSARVKYDSQNYNEPEIPTCRFVIEKCVIKIPTVTAVYNGEKLCPTSDSRLYSVEYDGEYTDAGRYAVRFVLNDADNYLFEGTADGVCDGIFEILPKTVYIVMDDVDLHLFERLGEVKYRINSSGAIGDDVLNISEYRDGDRIYLKCDNPNYTLSYTPATVNRLPYPSNRGIRNIALIFLSVALITVLIFVGVVQKHRILSAVAIIKCRWHNRNMSVYPPRFSESREMAEDKADKDGVAPTVGVADEVREEAIEEVSEEDTADSEEVSIEEIMPEPLFAIDASRADELISDSLAKSLLKKDGIIVYTNGASKVTVGLDKISEGFVAGERVDVNSLKERGIVPYDTAFLKVTDEGVIDKPLMIYANEFTLCAVKMISLTGGEAVKVFTSKKK